MNMATVIKESLEIFQYKAKAKGIDLISIIQANFPNLIRTDVNRLKQIIINLISNAIKYTQDGSVKIEVKAKE